MKRSNIISNVVEMIIETHGAEEAVKVAYKLSQRDSVLLFQLVQVSTF